MKAVLLSLAAFAAGVHAHGAVTSYQIDGVTFPGYQGFSPSPSYAGIQLQWPDYNPSTATASTTRCNGGTTAPSFASVNPGSTFRAYWAQWTHIPSSVAVYLYPCDSFPCTFTGSNWFKIDQAAVLSGTVGGDDWAGNFIIKKGYWESKIPANLKAGKYIIRHELIARHQANNPQFYAECAQIQVGGSGTVIPPSSYRVAIPSTAFANPSDNMLNFEVNGSTMPGSQYVISGPALYDFSSGGSSDPVTTTSTTTTTRTTTTTTRTTTTSQANNGQCTVTVQGPEETVYYTEDPVTVYVTVNGQQPTTTTTTTTTRQQPTTTTTTTRTTTTSSTGPAPSGLTVSDNFENGSSAWSTYAPDCNQGGSWSVTSGGHSGSGVTVNGAGGYCGHIFFGTKNVPSGDLYVRFWAKFSKSLTSSHVSFLTMDDTTTGKHLRMGGQSGILMWNRESDDATLPNLSPDGIAQSQAYTPGQWTCIEYHVGSGKLETWVNDQVVPGLTTGSGSYTSQFTSGAMNFKITSVNFGWESYGGDTNTVVYDDVAIGSSRIGCGSTGNTGPTTTQGGNGPTTTTTRTTTTSAPTNCAAMVRALTFC
ncbi:hypothetical protein HDV00_002363 [Rhizophlyctis rosea]|nr:hypothetical protein HDV00_002363 [Rhizophlyctis rosea]